MTKKYILKPGNHQFIPGSHAAHNNQNLGDDEAAWYLKAYPHIANLFQRIPTVDEQSDIRLQQIEQLIEQTQVVACQTEH